MLRGGLEKNGVRGGCELDSRRMSIVRSGMKSADGRKDWRERPREGPICITFAPAGCGPRPRRLTRSLDLRENGSLGMRQTHATPPTVLDANRASTRPPDPCVTTTRLTIIEPHTTQGRGPSRIPRTYRRAGNPTYHGQAGLGAGDQDPRYTAPRQGMVSRHAHFCSDFFLWFGHSSITGNKSEPRPLIEIGNSHR